MSQISLEAAWRQAWDLGSPFLESVISKETDNGDMIKLVSLSIPEWWRFDEEGVVGSVDEFGAR